MELLTKTIREQLIENGRKPDQDHIPIAKLFDPCSSATWLISELDQDGDTLFGLCDLGLGTPELGSVSLKKLISTRNRYGIGIERDVWFEPKHPLSAYAQAARQAKRIVELSNRRTHR